MSIDGGSPRPTRPGTFSSKPVKDVLGFIVILSHSNSKKSPSYAQLFDHFISELL